MTFPKEKPFNPSVSKVPVLGPSSGNPAAFQDPSSVASLGLKIQAASDQAKADTLYDATPPLEGFRNETYKPWILGTDACKKEGFNGSKDLARTAEIFTPLHSNNGYIGLGLIGLFLIYLSFTRRH
jgi:hypothetical protein